MDDFACALIDALGGLTKVARAMHAPVSTVSNMRSRLTDSRLNHLRRIAASDFPHVDVEALAEAFGRQLPSMTGGAEPSSGDEGEISQPGLAA